MNETYFVSHIHIYIYINILYIHIHESLKMNYGKGLEAEGVEGHVEKVGVVRRLGATATPQQPAMEQRLGALHARGAGQQRTGILRLRRINKEPRMA